ncbi:MAG: guanylate kinase [Pseudomonadota bacterium]
MSNKGELFMVAAPSGAGKTSLMRALLQRCPKLALSVSDTTRPARRDEVDGEQYHFLSVEEFEAGIEAGDYLEHAQVFGNYYGTRKDRVEALWEQGRDVLLEIDVQGARQVREQYPGLCSMFILPPSMKILAERLRGRDTDSPEVIERRLGEARAELEDCGDFRWMVINDDFDTALDELTAILRVWPLRRIRQSKHVTRLLDEAVARDTMRD